MFDQIKKWLDSTGGKYIIVEQGKPRYVIMKVKDFECLIGESPKIEKINQEIIALKEKEESNVDIVLDKLE
jgi:hypothetical protein